MSPWRLNSAEWQALTPIVSPHTEEPVGRGRPRNPVTRKLVEACLFRHHHSRSPRTGRSFGWNELPRSFGVSPASANRRYREWVADGTWGRVWSALLALRTAAASPSWAEEITDSGDVISPLHSPVAPAVVWLEQAYRHLNASLFGGGLPVNVVITLEDRPTRGTKDAFFCAGRWRSATHQTLHHIMMSAQAWAAGSVVLLTALLHEAVHARCHQLGLPDCNDRQYHNSHFRDTAVVSGLRCADRDRQKGYARTELDDRGREAVQAFVATNLFPTAPGKKSSRTRQEAMA